MSSLIPDNVSKHTNVYDVLVERGLVAQCTNPEKFRELLGNEKIKFYIGFDPTADCLHIGHFIPMITMMYMQKYGHTPVFLLGGGTGEIGDPSGKADMRQVMTIDTIDERKQCRVDQTLQVHRVCKIHRLAVQRKHHAPCGLLQDPYGKGYRTHILRVLIHAPSEL